MIGDVGTDILSCLGCEIHYDRENILRELDTFLELYSSRPVDKNDGGMKSPHLFNAWYAIKKLKPKLIIESGVWKGLGTWAIENAAPLSQIISIDINYTNLVYKSNRVTYLDHDITRYDWKRFFKDRDVTPEEVLVVLDDHQDFSERVKFLHDLGIRDVLYDDNYPPSHGDCLSPKKIISGKGKYDTFVTVKVNEDGSEELVGTTSFSYDDFMDRVDHYQELPPIFKVEYTRWGDKWDDINYPTSHPLLDNNLKEKYPTFYKEADSYTWLCYIKLANGKASTNSKGDKN